MRGTGATPLFRTPEGWRHFADAKTLRHLNTVFISRSVQAALAGDLLFYLQLEQDQPDHAMIHLGPVTQAVIYHTGGKPGEVRRLSLTQLRAYPDPRWRPEPGNPSFLGVHRWKILA